MEDIYTNCPVIKTAHFVLRLVEEADADGLFACYNDMQAVKFMNDDNCDFGFYTESVDKMRETIGYWVDFYKQRCFVRFAVIDNVTDKAVGTIEGFNGDIGVLRVDICSAFEKEEYLSELFKFATDNFRGFFGNERLVTKAIPEAAERRKALENNGWSFIGKFREFEDYFEASARRR